MLLVVVYLLLFSLWKPILQWLQCLVAQLWVTLCDPMDCSPPVSSVYGIFQARTCTGLPFPSPGALPHPGIKLDLLHWQADSLPLSHQGSPCSLFRAWLLLLFYTFPISNFNKSLQQASFKISFLVSFYVLGCKALTEFLSNSNSTYYFYFLVVISLTMFLFLNQFCYMFNIILETRDMKN